MDVWIPVGGSVGSVGVGVTACGPGGGGGGVDICYRVCGFLTFSDERRGGGGGWNVCISGRIWDMKAGSRVVIGRGRGNGISRREITFPRRPIMDH